MNLPVCSAKAIRVLPSKVLSQPFLVVKIAWLSPIPCKKKCTVSQEHSKLQRNKVPSVKC